MSACLLGGYSPGMWPVKLREPQAQQAEQLVASRRRVVPQAAMSWNCAWPSRQPLRRPGSTTSRSRRIMTTSVSGCATSPSRPAPAHTHQPAHSPTHLPNHPPALVNQFTHPPLTNHPPFHPTARPTTTRAHPLTASRSLSLACLTSQVRTVCLGQGQGQGKGQRQGGSIDNYG